MPDVQEVFRLATQKVRPDEGFVDRQLGRQRQRARNRRVGAFAVAAAIGAVAVVVIVSNRGGSNTSTPADEPTEAPTGTAASEIATGFLQAIGTFDAEGAIAYLADDADIRGLLTSLGAGTVSGTSDELRLLVSWLRAVGYEQFVGTACEERSSSASGSSLRCAYSFHSLGSREFGRIPFWGSYVDLVVRDGEIVEASSYWETARFSPQAWEPFADWVSATYPEDAAVMYVDQTYSGVRLTEDSIALWERRLDEYVDEVGTIRRALPGERSLSVDGIAFSFDVPAGHWGQFGTISINKSIVGPQGAEAMIFWTSYPRGNGATACGALLDAPAASSATDLAAAVAAAPGTNLVAGPSDVTIGGYPAKHVVVTVGEDLGCDPGYFYTWQDISWGPLWPETNVGDTIRVWIVDVGGTPLFIEAETTQDATPELEQEIDQIVGSIRFE